MQNKLPKYCMECEKYKSVDIVDFLMNKNSICNKCFIANKRVGN
jgi:hypothetical protein